MKLEYRLRKLESKKQFQDIDWVEVGRLLADILERFDRGEIELQYSENALNDMAIPPISVKKSTT